MRKEIVWIVYLIAFCCFAREEAEGLKAAEEQVAEELANNVEHYRAQFEAVPSSDDPRWKKIPKDEMAQHLQFLVDQQNANVERIRSWSGSYRHIRRSLLPIREVVLGETREPVSVLSQDLFSFACDFVADKRYLRMERRFEQYSDNRNAKTQNMDFRSILTKDVCLQYPFKADQRSGELQDRPSERLGKVCASMPPEQQRDVTRDGLLFEPRLFFYAVYQNDRVFKNWGNIEEGFLPWLKGEQSRKMKKVALARVAVWRGEFDGVVWYRVVYFDENGVDVFGEYAFNSKSNYNIALLAEGSERISARWVCMDDIFIPDRYLFERDGGDKFRYFELIDSEFNKNIPPEQFTVQTLGVEEGNVVVVNNAVETSRASNSGKSSTPGTFGKIKQAFAESSFGRSPMRLTAFAIGLGLVAFGLARRFLKRAERLRSSDGESSSSL